MVLQKTKRTLDAHVAVHVTPAPATIRTEGKNENLAAVSRFRPRASASVMVLPDRDTPGKIARACASPISTTSLKVAWFNARS